METEISPLSSRGSPQSHMSLLMADEEEKDEFATMIPDEILTEEEFLLDEVDELLRYRQVLQADDSGIGSSQETTDKDEVSNPVVQEHRKAISAGWTLPKIPKIPFSQYLGSK